MPKPMKLSALILKLEKLRDKHGNVNVSIFRNHIGDLAELCVYKFTDDTGRKVVELAFGDDSWKRYFKRYAR